MAYTRVVIEVDENDRAVVKVEGQSDTERVVNIIYNALLVTSGMFPAVEQKEIDDILSKIGGFNGRIGS